MYFYHPTAQLDYVVLPLGHTNASHNFGFVDVSGSRHHEMVSVRLAAAAT